MKTAVIIGDSHVEPGSPFAQSLASKLAAQGYKVSINGVGSSNAHMWATQQQVCRTGRCVDQTQVLHRPDLLIVSLGTNDSANAAAGGRSVAQAVADVKRVIAMYAPGQFVWVGPPATRDNVQYYTNAGIAQFYSAANAAGVPIFDSRPVTRAAVAAGSGDGVHLGPQGAAVWADAVAQAVASGGSSVWWKIALAVAGVAGAVALWKKYKR